ncbi:MAG: hypothetical protein JWM78_2138 [Verrucomicrobiaceae bacterium]|nr:hypothetical protein [Verrucomicrobiaceae bacterium]
MSTADKAAVSPLATDIQRDAELLALRIVASEPVRQAKAQIKRELLDDPLAATADGAKWLDRAIDYWTLSLALREAVGDTSRPEFVWPIDDTPRSWFGYDFPGSSVGGVANPDNVYRNAFLDGSRRYELRGRVHANAPTTYSVELTRQTPGQLMLTPAEGKLEADLGDQLGILTQRDIQTDSDGYFCITFDREPANGRINHLQTVEGPMAINHRDTLADWQQMPNSIELHALDGAIEPLATEQDLIQRTADHLHSYVLFWTPFRRHFLGAPPPNSVSANFPRDGGWGYAAGGRYALAADEALVIVTHSGNAAYTGFQISDAWMMVPDMRAHQGSLNGNQVVPDSDGSITYVIARRDPGVANWIDTADHAEGWFMLRWQELAKNVDASKLLSQPILVKLADLDGVVGDNVARIGAEERRSQLAKRRADYQHRIGK